MSMLMYVHKVVTYVMYRVILQEQARSTSGVWDAARRMLTLRANDDRVWAVHNTNSERGFLGTPLYYPSGACHFNGNAHLDGLLNIYFNEVSRKSWTHSPSLYTCAHMENQVNVIHRE
jgi:hypothetical protein